MATERFLQHGNDSLFFAVFNGSTYATPFKATGLISAEVENESESEAFYADNIAYATLKGAASSTITLTVPYLHKWMKTYLCGYEWDTNGLGCVSGNKSKVAIMYCENIVNVDTNETHRRLHIFYNCMLSGQPKLETETDEDKANVAEIELEFSATPHPTLVDNDGVPVSHVIVDENETTKPIFEQLGKSVYAPTFA